MSRHYKNKRKEKGEESRKRGVDGYSSDDSFFSEVLVVEPKCKRLRILQKPVTEQNGICKEQGSPSTEAIGNSRQEDSESKECMKDAKAQYCDETDHELFSGSSYEE